MIPRALSPRPLALRAVASVLVAATLLVVGPARAHAEAVFQRGQQSEPDSLDPHRAVAAAALIVINDLFEGLLTLDGHGRPVPGAAERYTVSPDGLTYTFTLRPNLVWSDGTPLTSADFLYSFRRLAEPVNGSSTLAGYLDLIRGGHAALRGEAPTASIGVSAPDARTIRIELEHPAPFFPTVIASPAMTPVPRHVIEKAGTAWTRPGTMVSNGAFVLADWTPNDRIRAVRNGRFHAAKDVKIDAVEYRPISDLNTGLRLLQTGQLDSLTNFPPEKLDWLKANMPKQLHLSPSLGVTLYVINHRLPKFRDARVRRALTLAIDREVLAGKIVRSGDRPAYGIVSDALPDYRGAKLRMPAAAARIAEARQLLAAAGYGPQRPLEVEVLYHTSEEHKKVAVAVAAMWQAIGVKAMLRNAERQVVEVSMRRGEFEIGRAAWFSLYDDPTGFLSFLRSSAPSNAGGYSNANFDARLDRADALPGGAERTAALREAEQIALDDDAVIPLYFMVSRRVVSARVQGWHDDNLTAFHPARWLSLAPAR